MVDKSFAKIREFRQTTIRVNAKNKNIPHPEFVSLFANGDNKGIIEFLEFWDMSKELGFSHEKGMDRKNS